MQVFRLINGIESYHFIANFENIDSIFHKLGLHEEKFSDDKLKCKTFCIFDN